MLKKRFGRSVISTLLALVMLFVIILPMPASALPTPCAGTHSGGTATCTSAKRCVFCGTYYGSALGHTGGIATCTSAKTCTRCKVKYGSALGHSYTNVHVSPTCTEVGYVKVNVCSRCGTWGGQKETTEPALGHDNSGATCKTAGKCSRCGVSGSKVAHSLQVTKAATCVVAGSKKCTMPDCTYTESINATGHRPQGGGNVITVPTCTKDGFQSDAYCLDCHEPLGNKTTIPALGHYPKGAITTIKAATCGATGTGIQKCSLCSEPVEVNISPTGQHRPSSSRYVIKASTCGEVGSESDSYCLDCYTPLGAITTIPTLKHSLVYTQVSSSMHRITCSGCNLNTTNPHTYGGAKCSDCGYVFANNCSHQESNRTEKRILPTCKRDLVIETWCDICKTLLNSQTISGTKGNCLYEHDSIVILATCFKEGISRYKCVDCPSSCNKVIAMKEHQYDYDGDGKCKLCGCGISDLCQVLTKGKHLFEGTGHLYLSNPIYHLQICRYCTAVQLKVHDFSGERWFNGEMWCKDPYCGYIEKVDLEFYNDPSDYDPLFDWHELEEIDISPGGLWFEPSKLF